MSINHEPFIIILSSPSGAGKTSISKAILKHFADIKMSISATTRPKRNTEIDGIDYYFISKEEFQNLLESDSFLEYANVYTNSYGTPRQYVQKLLDQNFDVLFDIDWQGMQAISKAMPHKIISIYILPPSIKELEKRLRERASDEEQIIKKRINEAKNDISHAKSYDYIIINDDLTTAIESIKAIILSERIKRTNLTNIIEEMCCEDE